MVGSEIREGDVALGSDGLERRTAAGCGTGLVRVREVAKPQEG